MSDSLSKFSESEKKLVDLHNSFVKKKSTNFENLLNQGLELQGMGKVSEKKELGPMEQLLHNQHILMEEIQKLKTFTGLKPELIKLTEMKYYYPEFSSSANIVNKICQGKKYPYVVKHEGRWFVQSKKYEIYRKAVLGL